MYSKLLPFIILVILHLSGCTGLGSISSHELNYNLEIKNISFGDKPNKSAYFLKKRLNELLIAQNNPGNADNFYLNISVAKSIVNYGTQQNSINTRSILKFACEYSIIDHNDKIIDSGNATVADSYEISTSLYSSVITEEATSERLASTLASELKNIVNSKIIKYLHRSETQSEHER